MNRLKKRSSHRVPLAPSAPSSSAALAATSAFVKSANSNASLSSAAAAAALRSHTPPPTNPADIQTKRMVRRGSTSSQGSAQGSRTMSPARPGLQRTNSSGSMTERSFRSPSPYRPGTANSTRPAARDAPPVPALPAGVNTQYVQQKRASSVEPQYQRMQSPQPTRNGGRGMSVDTANRTLPPLNTDQPSSPTISKRNSVNFSRPMSPPLSPTSESSPVARQGRSGWHTAPVSSNAEPRQTAHEQLRAPTGAGAANAYFVQQSIQDTANAPVKTRKKKAQAAAPTFKPTMVYDPNSRTMKPASEMYPPVPRRDEPEPPVISTNLAARTQQGFSPVVERQQPQHQRSASGLTKQPSIVRERRGEEEEAEATSPRYTRVTSPTPAQSMPRSAATQSPPPYQHTRTGSLQREAVTNAREASSSPSRQARFSAAPLVFSQNDIRHDPPPRSLSPAKPALKHSPASSVRTASPVANFAQSPTPRVPPSDASISGSDDGTRPVSRKKSVRVSFGDEPPQIIPESASPPPMAPARPVYDDENFEMAPRPVLPSFGSVRGRGRQSPSIVPERAVKVTETVPSTSTSARGSSDSTAAPGLESSSDLALGGILSEDLLAREAFLAGESDEKGASDRTSDLDVPVPPQVTSVEGSGYVSEPSDIDADDAAAAAAAVKAPPAPTAPTVVAHPTKGEEQTLAMSGATLVPDEAEKNLVTEQPGPIAATVKSPDEVPTVAELPTVAVQPPTPAAEVTEAEGFQLNMPGGSADLWDDEGSDRARGVANDQNSEAVANEQLPSTQPTQAQDSAPAVPVVAPVLGKQPLEEESETDSIYSDAEEEMSDHEGFASLNAIVESPIVSPSESPVATRGPNTTTPLAQSMENEPVTADWAEQKAYWSQLSEQRKQELERQARPDAFVEEPTPTPAPRPAKQLSAPVHKQSTTIASAAATAAAPTLAAESAAASRPPKEQRPMRSSMRQTQPQPVSQTQRDEVRMRRSMRGSSDQDSNESEVRHFRQSMRSGPGAGAGASSSRPVSSAGPGLQQSRYAAPPPPEPRGALQKRNLSPPSAPSQRPQQQRTASGSRVPSATPSAKTYAMPSLVRRGSGDSDSSFKRSRNRPSGSVMSDGGISMRRTMRGSAEPVRAPAPAPLPAPTQERKTMARSLRPQSPVRPATSSGLSPEKARRFSLRSLSPSGSLLGGRKKLRTSTDERAGPSHPTHSRTRSADILATSTSVAQQRQSAPIPAPTMRARETFAPTSGFKSRYADDSDDDDSPIQRRPFRSRFLDSDDEDDEPQTLTPVRGIPRKPGAEDGDSTDLEEESELGELPSRKPKEAPAAQGSALAAGSLRSKTSAGASGTLADSKYAPAAAAAQDTAPPNTTPPRKEKRSFFSIRRPKRASSVPPRATPPIDYTQPLPTTSNVQAPPTARPGSRPQSPKLQRRRTPQSITRMGSDSWPLTPTPGTADVSDPLAASGAAAPTSALRPDVGKRRSTIDGSGPGAPGLRFDEANVESTGGGEPKSSIFSAKTGKKKKFPMLRKAFGLND